MVCRGVWQEAMGVWHPETAKGQHLPGPEACRGLQSSVRSVCASVPHPSWPGAGWPLMWEGSNHCLPSPSHARAVFMSISHLQVTKGEGKEEKWVETEEKWAVR